MWVKEKIKAKMDGKHNSRMEVNEKLQDLGLSVPEMNSVIEGLPWWGLIIDHNWLPDFPQFANELGTSCDTTSEQSW
jgi:hypothetical protein